MGDLGEQACTIPRAVGSTRTPMVESLQTLHSQAGHPVGRSAVEGGDEPDAAGVVFDALIEMKCRHSEPRVENETF